MGLDMYLYKKRLTGYYAIPEDPPEEQQKQYKLEEEEIAYWRKHNRLHGYMTRIWLAKNPEAKANDFNCIPLELSKQDIDNIIAALVHETMPPTQGFFFGFDSYDPEQYKKDVKLFQECLGLQEQGWTIIYNSWW